MWTIAMMLCANLFNVVLMILHYMHRINRNWLGMVNFGDVEIGMLWLCGRRNTLLVGLPATVLILNNTTIIRIYDGRCDTKIYIWKEIYLFRSLLNPVSTSQNNTQKILIQINVFVVFPSIHSTYRQSPLNIAPHHFLFECSLSASYPAFPNHMLLQHMFVSLFHLRREDLN